jgi:REP element-mobilizing transposase RayT
MDLKTAPPDCRNHCSVDGSGRPDRKTADLRRERSSIPHSIYFCTWCTAGRNPILSHPVIVRAIHASLQAMEANGDARVLAATTMADHVHLLSALGPKYTIGRVIGKLKSAVRRQNSCVTWQRNFFEHRLRPDEHDEDYAFYIFMNPYRAGICSIDSAWKGWVGPHGFRWGFEDKLRPGSLPRGEWLAAPNESESGLSVGCD